MLSINSLSQLPTLNSSCLAYRGQDVENTIFNLFVGEA